MTALGNELLACMESVQRQRASQPAARRVAKTPNRTRDDRAPLAKERAAAALPQATISEPDEYGLTAREFQVLAAAACGYSNLEIGKRLGISEGTVKIHLNNIYRKLNVRNRVEACSLGRQLEGVRRVLDDQAQSGAALIDWLIPYINHESHKRGEVLFQRGAPGRSVYFIKQGRVCLDEIGVAMVEGELFGEIALFAPDQTRTCTARCDTDVHLFRLDAGQVDRLCMENPRFSKHMMHLMARRLLADRARVVH